MIGRTNAGAGGMKYVTGSFTSSKTATQKSFTVSGLDFEPKVIAIKRTSLTEGTTGGGTGDSLIYCAFSDLENGTGFLMPDTSGASAGFKTSSYLSVSESDGTFTVKLKTYTFSDYTSTSRLSYGKFTYYIYG